MLREDVRPLIADLERERDEIERHLRKHPCSGAKLALVDLTRSESQLYQWLADEEAATS